MWESRLIGAFQVPDFDGERCGDCEFLGDGDCSLFEGEVACGMKKVDGKFVSVAYRVVNCLDRFGVTV